MVRRIYYEGGPQDGQSMPIPRDLDTSSMISIDSGSPSPGAAYTWTGEIRPVGDDEFFVYRYIE